MYILKGTKFQRENNKNAFTKTQMPITNLISSPYCPPYKAHPQTKQNMKSMKIKSFVFPYLHFYIIFQIMRKETSQWLDDIINGPGYLPVSSFVDITAVIRQKIFSAEVTLMIDLKPKWGTVKWL